MPVLPGHPPLEITLRRSAATRRFSLRVSQLDGRVTLSMPSRAREAEAMAFLRAHEGWLRTALAKRPAGQRVGLLSQVPIEGRLFTVQAGSGRSVRIEDDRLLLPGDPQQFGARAQAFLKVLARDRLAAASDHYAAVLGRSVARVTLRDTRSRWGSCSHAGALMYSWRLIMAPPAVLTYVAAHEVAHMLQMNHSAAFWTVVERLEPGWQAHRRWLHANGPDLHAYDFGGGDIKGD